MKLSVVSGQLSVAKPAIKAVLLKIGLLGNPEVLPCPLFSWIFRSGADN
jgi:hypothetical protein